MGYMLYFTRGDTKYFLAVYSQAAWFLRFFSYALNSLIAKLLADISMETLC